MTTRAQSIARIGTEWVVGVRFTGLGEVVDGEARGYTFSTAVPTYAAGDPTWLPLLTSLPDTLSDRVPARGGLRTAGSFTFELLDEADLLTALFRWDAPAHTQVWQEFVEGWTTTIEVRRIDGINAGDILWIGAEAMRVIATHVGSREVDVERGVLGTEIRRHYLYDEVRLYTPRLEGRELELFLVARDADDHDQRIVVDTYSIVRVGWSDDWTRWRFETATRSLGLKRTIGAISAGHYRIVSHVRGSTFLLARIGTGGHLRAGLYGSLNPWEGERSWFVINDQEVAIGEGARAGAFDQLELVFRARLGSSAVDIDPAALGTDRAGPLVRPALVASLEDGIGSFRRSTTGAVDRTDPSWEADDHWVTIFLALALSSRTPDDGLELVNFLPGETNYSALAPGWGAGLRRAVINVPAFEALRARTPDWRLPGFILAKPSKLWEVLAKHVLEPFGIFLTVADGLITPVLPRLPAEGEPLVTYDADNILVSPRAGRLAPSASGGYDASSTIRGVLFRTRGPGGEDVETLITLAELAGVLGERDPAGTADDYLTLELPSVLADQAGVAAFFEDLAVRHLVRATSTPVLLELVADLGTYDRPAGSLAFVTFALGPNASTGTRGWTDVPFLLLERSLPLGQIARGGKDPVGWRLKLLGYGSRLRVGLVAPSALITTWGAAGALVAEVEANRYTDAAGLEDDDASVFEVGARCLLLRADGTRASPISGGTTYQTIVDVGPGYIELDGDWDGTAAAGLVIALADYDDAREDEAAIYVADADRETRTVGASSVAPWAFGEV